MARPAGRLFGCAQLHLRRGFDVRPRRPSHRRGLVPPPMPSGCRARVAGHRGERGFQPVSTGGFGFQRRGHGKGGPCEVARGSSGNWARRAAASWRGSGVDGLGCCHDRQERGTYCHPRRRCDGSGDCTDVAARLGDCVLQAPRRGRRARHPAVGTDSPGTRGIPGLDLDGPRACPTVPRRRSHCRPGQEDTSLFFSSTWACLLGSTVIAIIRPSSTWALTTSHRRSIAGQGPIWKSSLPKKRPRRGPISTRPTESEG